jgi:N-acetylglutamate synthase-like GNAT family acetyltransferase
MCIPTRIQVRRATTADATAIHTLQARALRAQSSNDNAPELDAFIEQTDLLDAVALAHGYYFVADFGGCILACGGWTAHEATKTAVMLGVFVDDDFAAAKLGTRILWAIEDDVAAHGLAHISAMSTYTGMPFYQRMGYRPSALVSERLPSGLEIHGVELCKSLPVPRGIAA